MENSSASLENMSPILNLANVQGLKKMIGASIICRVCGKFDTSCVLMSCGHLICCSHVGNEKEMIELPGEEIHHSTTTPDGYEVIRKEVWEKYDVYLGPVSVKKQVAAPKPKEEDVQSVANSYSGWGSESEDGEATVDEEEQQKPVAINTSVPAMKIGSDGRAGYYCRQCKDYCPLEVDTKSLNKFPLSEIEKIFALFFLAYNQKNNCKECKGQQKEGDWCCIDCSEHYCNGHATLHKNSKTFNSHIITSTRLLRDYMVQWVLLTSDYCLMHPSKKYITLCVESGKKYCPDCGDIFAPDAVPIQEYQKAFRNTKKNCLNSIKKNSQYLIDIENRERKTSTSRDFNYEETVTEITTFSTA